MKKILSLFLISSFIILFPMSASASDSLKPKITPKSEANITYVSTPEEYLNIIKDPSKTTVNIIRDLDLRDLDFKNDIYINGFDRLINFNNRFVSVSEDNDFNFIYNTNHSLNLRSTIGFMTHRINALPEPRLLKTTKNGSGIIENPAFDEKILIDNELLDLENNPTLIRDGKVVAKFSKTISKDSDVKFFLELSDYSGDNIEFLGFPNYSYLYLRLSGKNTIKTEKEVGIKLENTIFYLESADSAPATLNIEVNSKTDTAIGIARGLENPEDQQNLSVFDKDLTLNLSLKNSTPSDSPFLTGFYARHGTINLTEPTKISIDLNPTLISKEISSTNNLTGATTELDGSISLYRNNLTVNNRKGTYGFWSGTVSFLDGNITGSDPYSDLSSPETKIIVKNSATDILNHPNINDVYYNTDLYVEKIEEKDDIKTSTLKNLVNYVDFNISVPESLFDFEIDDALDEIETSFTSKDFSKAELDKLSILKDPSDDEYYLEIDLVPLYRYGFKENCPLTYSYKDIFVKENAFDNMFYVNNKEIENYRINSIDSASVFLPLSVIETEPETQETPEEPEEPEEPTISNETPETPEASQTPTENPLTSTGEISPLYYLLLLCASFSLFLISRKSLL